MDHSVRLLYAAAALEKRYIVEDFRGHCLWGGVDTAISYIHILPLYVLLQSKSSAEGFLASMRSGYDLYIYCRLVFSMAQSKYTGTLESFDLSEVVCLDTGCNGNCLPTGNKIIFFFHYKIIIKTYLNRI